MTDSTRDILREMMELFSRLTYIKPDEIPDIPLYMDQITTFMETKLDACKRYPDEKILTKTMINNYTKNRLIPPPDKKKYSKDHLILLLFIYYFKDFLSISDIDAILRPIEENHFQTEDGLTMSEIYSEVFSLIKDQTGSITRDLLRRWKLSEKTFGDVEGDQAETLHLFAFTCLLSFDVYVKKKMIEAAVDALGEKKKEKEKEKGKEKGKEKEKEKEKEH